MQKTRISNFEKNGIFVLQRTKIFSAAMAIGSSLATALALFCAAILMSPQSAHAEFSSIPNSGTLGADGTISAIVATSSGIYIGGAFSNIGTPIGSVMSVATSTGTITASFPAVIGTVFAMIPDRSGGWYISGTFTQVGSVARNNLAHVLSNNTVDPNFNPNVNSGVYSLALSSDGSTLYAGGAFATVGGVTYNNFAAINTSNGTAIAAFNPNMNATVLALALSPDGSTIYAGGSFNTVGGVTYNSLAAINTSNGAASTTFNPNMFGSVSALALSSDGSMLYVGGQFTSVGGVTYNKLAAINTSNGVASTTFNPNMDSLGAQVGALLLSPNGSTLYVGGQFTTINGVTYNNLAAVNTSNGVASTTFNPNVNNSVGALALSPDGSTLYAGGTFTSVGGVTYNRLAAISTVTASATPAFNPNAISTVNAVALSSDGSQLYVGGGSFMINIVPRKSLARILPNGSVDPAFDPNMGNTVFALALSPDGSTLYAGGAFTTVGGVTYNRLAAINTVTASATPAFNPNVNSTVSALALSSDDSTLYAGGALTTVGGVTYNRLAAVNTSNGAVSTTFNPNLNGPVSALVLSYDGSMLYTGGQFTTVGGVTYNRLAAISTATASATPAFNPNVNNTVNALALSSDGSTLYTGGNFTTIGGVTYNKLAAISTATASATPAFNPNIVGNVNSLALSTDGSTLYTGGNFTTVGGVTYNRLAAISTATASATPAFNPNMSATVSALALSSNGSTLYTGGSFGTVGGVIVYRLAFFTYLNPPTVTSSAPSSVSASAATLNGSLTNDGNASSTVRGFAYGTTNAYGATTTESGTFNLGAFSAAISSLACNTVYHFAPYAVNSAGTSTYPADATFTTSPCPVTATSQSGSVSSGGGSISSTALVALLAPSASTTLYLDSLDAAPVALVPGCPVGFICKPIYPVAMPANAVQTAPTASFAFARNLYFGATGADVKELQIFLNSHGFIIAKIGPGSPGDETDAFGALTRAALARFQKANGIVPSAGYFGPITRRYVENS